MMSNLVGSNGQAVEAHFSRLTSANSDVLAFGDRLAFANHFHLDGVLVVLAGFQGGGHKGPLSGGGSGGMAVDAQGGVSGQAHEHLSRSGQRSGWWLGLSLLRFALGHFLGRSVASRSGAGATGAGTRAMAAAVAGRTVAAVAAEQTEAAVAGTMARATVARTMAAAAVACDMAGAATARTMAGTAVA